MKLIFVFMFIHFSNINAQYLPYRVAPLSSLNNYWVYKETYNVPPSFTVYEIVDTAKVIDSIKYCEISVGMGHLYAKAYARLREDGYYVLKRDSIEEIYYKKNASYNDKWSCVQTGNPYDTIYYEVVDTFSTNYFSQWITLKLIHMTNYGGLLDTYQVWTEEFGCVAIDHGEGLTDLLVGCIMNNVLYGDTTIVGINGRFISQKYWILYQNYPNPFNPNTIIEYEIPKENFVSVKVFNILGEEVNILVNESQTAGKYSVQFNGSGFPNGVYIYQLKTDEFISSKKMIILK